MSALSRHGKAWLGPAGWVDHDARIVLLELSHHFSTAGAVMLFVPEAVHGGAQEAHAQKERHHASHN